MDYNLQHWMHSQRLTNGGINDCHSRPIQPTPTPRPNQSPPSRLYPTPAPSPQSQNTNQSIADPNQRPTYTYGNYTTYRTPTCVDKALSPSPFPAQLPYNPKPGNPVIVPAPAQQIGQPPFNPKPGNPATIPAPAQQITQPADQIINQRQLVNSDQEPIPYTPLIKHLGVHLQYISPATGLPTPYYLPSKLGHRYKTLTSHRTDALVFPTKGMEMSKEQRLKEIMGPSEEEKEEIEQREREAKMKQLRRGDEEREKRRENDVSLSPIGPLWLC